MGSPGKSIRLVCLDFDGTIMDYDDPRGSFHAVAIEALNALESRGVSWCTNSGRDQLDQHGVLERSTQRGLRHMPAALLCSESMGYLRHDGSYVPMEPWNSRVGVQLKAFHRQVQEILDGELESIAQRYESCPVYVGDHYTVFKVDDHDELPARLHNELRNKLAALDGCNVTRNGGWVAVITDTVGKGNVLREFMNIARYQPEEVLAIGDQFNDLTMLDGRFARHVGCPANSIPEVMETVAAAGGYIAKGEHAEGSVEVIGHFLGRA